MRIDSKRTILFFVIFITSMTTIPFLGLTDYHTKGEPREAIVAVSMLQSDNWILPINNGGDIAYKPPFFHWLIAAISAPLGGVSEFSSRLPSSLALIFMTIACFLFFARRTRNDLAFLTSILFISTFEVHRAAMACRVDMVLTACIVMALLQLYKWTEHGLKGIPIFAIVLMSFGALTKGPVGIILPCAVTGIYLLIRRKNVLHIIWKFSYVFILSCVLPAIWYLLAYKQGGENFITLVMEENFGRFMGKMSYESHNEPIVYYIYTTIAGFIPWSILVLFSLFVLKYKRPDGKLIQLFRKGWSAITGLSDVRLFSFLSFAIIFIFYCIPSSKRTVYLLPIYPFLSLFLAEYMLYLLKRHQKAWRSFGVFMTSLTFLLIASFITLNSGLLSTHLLPGKLGAEINHYAMAFSASHWNIFDIACIIVLLVVMYQLYKSKREITLNNRYLYSVIALFFWVQISLDAIILPTILNAKSMRPFAEKVTQVVPEGKIYSFVGSPMMRFFVINFYNNNRVVNFETEKPDAGYLLVGKNDFNYIQDNYTGEYTFEPVLKSARKGNDVKDIIYMYHFKKKSD